MVQVIVASVALAAWLYLTVMHGGFWRTSIRLPPRRTPDVWPHVVAVVPARDEAAMLPSTLPTLLAQQYVGDFQVIVVDDASTDETGAIACELGAQVVEVNGPPPGWAGKVNAMAAGVGAAGKPDYLLFTDADIRYPATALTELVEAATTGEFDLTSQMVRLRAVSFWERVVVPAFVYFFAQLYPFSRVNTATSKVAAAAGGCMLVRASALASAGGLEQIAGAHIDDVALGRLLKRNGGRIWLGLSSDVESVRPYPKLADLWHMVSRSAYTQLGYSPLLLLATVIGLLLVYVVPPAALITGLVRQDAPLASIGAAAWLLMTVTYFPIVRFYRLSPWRALTLPLIALLYLSMTLDSARRHVRGRGGGWKGRTIAAVRR